MQLNASTPGKKALRKTRLGQKIVVLAKISWLICCTICCTTHVFAQSNANSPYIPNMIPPSPNAATLMKFSDVPVSTYTGTADVTVPIYTIHQKGFQIPINISYHTGGIRLKEEASWVGLGWALQAGGAISRTIMGKDDFGTQGDIYFATQVPQLPGDLSHIQPAQAEDAPVISPYFFDFWCNYQVSTTSGTEDFWPAFTSGSDIYDMEPDIFSYSFPGHSGKFILTRTGKVVMEKQDNIKIQFQGGGSTVTFNITDDEGNRYFFNNTEAQMLGGQGTQITSWFLSRVITQESDTVTFNYQDGGSTTSVAADYSQTYGSYCTAMSGLTTTLTNPYAYTNQTLKSIDYSNGQIQFIFDSTRNDLTGAYRLDSVRVFSKNAAGALTFLKQDNFYYSYFNPTYGAVATNPAEYYRLKLDSVKEVSGNYSSRPYSFIYNNPDPGSNTAKHAYNVDHWGYYNGADNAGLIPTMDIGYNPIVQEIGFGIVLHYSGANRQPDFNSMQTFSLQQVTYPTGGKTVFAYEPNDYDYTNSTAGGAPAMQYVQTISMDSMMSFQKHGLVSGTIDLSHVFPALQTLSAGQTNVNVSVAFRYLNNNNSTYANTVGKIYFTLGGTSWDINGASCGTNSPVCTANLALGMNSTVYSWSAYIDPSIDTVSIFAGIYVSITYQETQQVYNLLQNNSAISPASGLRIHSVTNYKDPSTIATKKVYAYTYQQDKLGTGTPQQYSYGRLMSIPTYARYAITSTSQGGYCTALVLFSSSITSLTSANQGNIVGYDQVTETTVDPSSGQDIGKTVYTYHNNSDTIIQYNGYGIPGVQNMGDNLNGQLISKVDYSNNGGVYNKVKQTNSYYHTTNRIVYYSPKYQFYPTTGGTGTGCAADTGVETQTSAWFYPSIKSERILLDSTYDYTFDQDNPASYLLDVTRNYYDNTVHYLPTREYTTDSKGNTLVTKLTYPQDYLPPGNSWTGNTVIDTMILRNMVAGNIEKRDSLYYSGSSQGYVTGGQLNLHRLIPANNNTVVQDKIYKLDLQAPVTNFQPFSFSGNTLTLDSRYRQMASFDLYDPKNNIQQYTTADQGPVTMIWDYNYRDPIAQTRNAALADVAATSFEADGKGGWTFSGAPISDATAPTGSMCYGLASGSISRSGLTSSTAYVVSYWSKTGASYAVSGSTGVKQGKTINGWTYFEHTVTGVTSVTLSGSGSIDELRLYPSTAQMTTYTYSPLVGMTTACDPGNRITYYFYDGLQRLKWVKDQDGNIIKSYQYHYIGGNTQF